MEFSVFEIRFEGRLRMKRSKFSERQVLGILKAVESGRKQTRSNSSSSSKDARCKTGSIRSENDGGLYRVL